MKPFLNFVVILIAWTQLSFIRASTEQQCQLGPLYTCQNVNNSLSCNSFNECLPYWKSSKSSQLVSASFSCQFCSLLMKDVQNILHSKVVKAEAIKAVNQFCTGLSHASLKSACLQMVNTYLTTAMDMLASEIEPQIVCQAIHACSGSAYMPQNFSSILRLRLRETRRSQAYKLKGMQIAPGGVDKVYLKATPSECTDCQQFIQDVKTRLISNTTEQQLEAIFDETVCTALPPSVVNICRDAVHIYVDELLMMLNQEMIPEQYCALLGFCDTDKLKLLQKALQQVRKSYTNKNTISVECGLCKGVVSRARMLLNDPKVEQKVSEVIIEEICPLVSLQGTKKCQQWADMYVPVLLGILSSEVDPLVVCETVRMCSYESVEAPSTSLSTPSSTSQSEFILPPLVLQKNIGENGLLQTSVVGELSTCQLCDVLLQVVNKRGLVYTTEANFIAALREICVVFPDNVAHRCDQLVDYHGKLLAGTMVSRKTQTEAKCPLMECQPSTTTSSDTLIFKPVQTGKTNVDPTTGSSVSCDLCKQAVKEAESYVRQNYTEAQLEAYLESWCQSIPQAYRDQCVSLVKEYLPYVIDAIVLEASPETVCSEIELCTKEIYNHLLGRRRCTWGPSYWCSSLLKAHRCRAVEHCQTKVWLAKKPSRSFKVSS